MYISGNKTMVLFQLTREDQQRDDNWRRYTLSRWAECSTLKSPYDGDIRLVLLPGEWRNTCSCICTHRSTYILLFKSPTTSNWLEFERMLFFFRKQKGFVLLYVIGIALLEKHLKWCLQSSKRDLLPRNALVSIILLWFVVFMKGPCDALLKWSFKQKVG